MRVQRLALGLSQLTCPDTHVNMLTLKRLLVRCILHHLLFLEGLEVRVDLLLESLITRWRPHSIILTSPVLRSLIDFGVIGGSRRPYDQLLVIHCVTTVTTLSLIGVILAIASVRVGLGRG